MSIVDVQRWPGRDDVPLVPTRARIEGLSAQQVEELRERLCRALVPDLGEIRQIETAEEPLVNPRSGTLKSRVFLCEWERLIHFKIEGSNGRARVWCDAHGAMRIDLSLDGIPEYPVEHATALARSYMRRFWGDPGEPSALPVFSPWYISAAWKGPDGQAGGLTEATARFELIRSGTTEDFDFLWPDAPPGTRRIILEWGSGFERWLGLTDLVKRRGGLSQREAIARAVWLADQLSRHAAEIEPIPEVHLWNCPRDLSGYKVAGCSCIAHDWCEFEVSYFVELAPDSDDEPVVEVLVCGHRAAEERFKVEVCSRPSSLPPHRTDLADVRQWPEYRSYHPTFSIKPRSELDPTPLIAELERAVGGVFPEATSLIPAMSWQSRINGVWARAEKQAWSLDCTFRRDGAVTLLSELHIRTPFLGNEIPIDDRDGWKRFANDTYARIFGTMPRAEARVYELPRDHRAYMHGPRAAATLLWMDKQVRRENSLKIHWIRQWKRLQLPEPLAPRFDVTRNPLFGMAYSWTTGPSGEQIEQVTRGLEKQHNNASAQQVVQLAAKNAMRLAPELDVAAGVVQLAEIYLVGTCGLSNTLENRCFEDAQVIAEVKSRGPVAMLWFVVIEVPGKGGVSAWVDPHNVRLMRMHLHEQV